MNNVSPLGFILGDEGSGAVLGKLLVGDILKNQMTPELKEKVFYGVIRKYENISTILDMLKKTQNIDYLIEGKKIVIKEVR